jgi:hypothetical protein
VSAFNIALNPFAILGVSPRANAAELSDARSDRLFDGDVDEGTLDSAFSDLTVDARRLPHELSWLSDMSPSRASALSDRLKKITEGDIADVTEDAPQLARLNLLAHLLSAFPRNQRLFRSLLAAHSSINWRSVRQQINESRQVAGFPAVRDTAWDQAQNDLVDRHAGVFVDALVKLESGPETLAAILDDSALCTGAPEVIEQIINRYDRWTIPQLERISGEIDQALENIKSDDSPKPSIDTIKKALGRWKRLSLPVQLRDHEKGLDEPRSLQIFYKIRDAALWFANDCDKHDVAHDISQSLSNNFEKLPTATKKTADDLETLSELLEADRQAEILRPLQLAAKAAIDELALTEREVDAGQFRAGQTTVVGRLFSTFETARQRCSELSDIGLPWILVRSVALDLHNERDASHAARTLLEAILPSAPLHVAKKIREDLKTLRSVELQGQFAAALKKNDLARASELVKMLIAEGTEDTYKLGLVQKQLEERIRSRTLKRWGWGAFAALALFAIFSADKKPTYTPPTTYEGEDSNFAGAAEQNVAETENPASVNEDDFTETAPPQFNSLPLTIDQVRYCKFESARLDSIKKYFDGYSSEPVTMGQASEFGQKVDAYNAICANFRYRENDMQVVDWQLALRQAEIEKEALATLRSWSTTSAVPQISPPVSYDGPSDAGEATNGY